MHRAYHPTPQTRKRRIRWLAVLPWLLAAYLVTGVYSVGPNERAVVRRCGKPLEAVRTPGLHVGLPYGIDRVTRLKVFERKRVAVGMSLAERSLGRPSDPQQAERLTGDRNLILVSAVVQYRIADPKAYLFHVADVPSLVANVASSALTSEVTSMNVDDVLTVERLAIQNKVKEATQRILDSHGPGVEVTSVSLEDVSPPKEVAQAFRDVTAAREDSQRTINEAQGYANRLIPQARGERERMRLEAEAFRDRVTKVAAGDAESFTKIAAQLSENRRLTVKRLILETMERVLPRLKKIVLDDQAGDGVDLGLIEADE
ncbi:MAG: FtsH protease activity modulator HflK [Planctomycetota bacterium]